MPQSVEQAIEDKLRTGGELQILLSEWQDSLPPAFRYVSNELFAMKVI